MLVFLRFLVVRSSQELAISNLGLWLCFIFLGFTDWGRSGCVYACLLCQQSFKVTSLPLWPKYWPWWFNPQSRQSCCLHRGRGDWCHCLLVLNGVPQLIPWCLFLLLIASVASELGAALEALLCFLGIFVVLIWGCDFLLLGELIFCLSFRDFLKISGPPGTLSLSSSPFTNIFLLNAQILSVISRIQGRESRQGHVLRWPFWPHPGQNFELHKSSHRTCQ